MKNPEKSEKKVLTKREGSDIIIKLSGERKVQTKRLKKLEKSFAKPLDKAAAK